LDAYKVEVCQKQKWDIFYIFILAVVDLLLFFECLDYSSFILALMNQRYLTKVVVFNVINVLIYEIAWVY